MAWQRSGNVSDAWIAGERLGCAGGRHNGGGGGRGDFRVSAESLKCVCKFIKGKIAVSNRRLVIVKRY